MFLTPLWYQIWKSHSHGPSGFEWMRSGAVSQFGMPNEKKAGHAEAWELC